jgi:ABC-type lipoprotein release transport system permease subunit
MVACVDEFRNDGGTDEARGAGEKDTHLDFSLSIDVKSLVLGASTAMLGTIALLASILPARRAAAVEPMEALRGE